MADTGPLPAASSLRDTLPGGAFLRAGLRGGHWVLSSQIITSAANLATTVVLLRGLGLEAFGQFSLCFLFLMVVRNFFHGAILAPSSTLAPRLRSTSLNAFRGVLVIVTLGFAIVSSGVVALLAYVLAPVLQVDWLTGLILPLVAANVAGCFADLISRYHLIYARPQRTFGTEVVRYAVQLGVLIILVALGAAWLSPAVALLVLATGSVAAVVSGVIGHAQLTYSKRLFRVLWPRYWNFVRWMSLSNFFETVQTLAPMLVGLALLGEAALGVLRAVSQLTNILNLPTNALQQLLPISGTKVYKSGGSKGLTRMLASVIGLVLIYFLVVSAALFALSPWISNFLFDQTPATFLAILLWFVAANLFISARQVMSTVFVVKERPQNMLLIQGVSAVVAVLLPFAAAIVGVIAVPISVAVSTGVGMAICYRRARQEMRNG